MKKALKIGAVVVAGVLILGAVGITLALNLNRDPNEIKLGSKAPDLSLINTRGETVTLAGLQKKGRPVLVFYRGKF